MMLCGYTIPVMVGVVRLILPDEARNTDKALVKQSLYRGPVPSWIVWFFLAIGTVGLVLMLGLILADSFSPGI